MLPVTISSEPSKEVNSRNAKSETYFQLSCRSMTFTIITLLTFVGTTLLAIAHIDPTMQKNGILTSSTTMEKLFPISTHSISRGFGMYRNLLDGCVMIRQSSSSMTKEGDYTTVCLTGSERLQSHRMSSDSLGIRGDVSLVTGADAFVNMYYKNKPVASVFSSSEADLGNYLYDEIEVSYIKEHVFSDPLQIMVEVDGAIYLPANCAMFSNVDPSLSNDPSSLVVCGAAGKESVLLNTERLSEIGIDMRKLSNDFSFVSMGGLADGEFATNGVNLNGPSFHFGSGMRHDMSGKEFKDHMGAVRKLSEHLSAVKLSFA